MKILTHNKHFQNIFSSVAGERKPLFVLLTLFSILTIITYGKWMTIIGFDVNRELIVPHLINNGFFIYSDFHYNYGPLVPYLLAIFVKILGYKFVSFYIIGIFLALCYMVALYYAARLFFNRFYSTITCILFLLQCVFFNNAIFSFIVPYSYATVFCGLLIVIMLIYLIKHFETSNIRLLFIPFICCSLCLLTKQDYFIISSGTILFYLGFYAFVKSFNKKPSNFIERAIFTIKSIDYRSLLYFCLVAAIPSIIIYGLISLKTGLPLLVNCLFPFENLKHPVVKCFIAVICRGGYSSANLTHMLFYAFFSAITLMILFYFLYLCIILFEKKKPVKASLIIILGLLIIFFCLIKLNLLNPAISLIIELKYIYSGINLWLILLLIYSLYKVKDNTYQKLTLLLFVALITNFRTFYGMDLSVYSFYYLPLTLIVFVFIINTIFPHLFKTLFKMDSNRCFQASGVLLIVICFSYFLLLAGLYKNRTRLIQTPLGPIYQENFQPEELDRLLTIINDIKSLTNKTDKIIVYPSRLEYYVLSNRLPASRYYYLTPGTINTVEEELQIINEINKNNTKLIIIAKTEYLKRSLKQFQESYIRAKKHHIDTSLTELTFGKPNYHPTIYNWVKENYKLHKTYFFSKYDPPLTIEIYSK